MQATTFRCSSCGGEVDARARVCRYCRAPVASVRCLQCYEMNVPDALHCCGCGRQLGLEPVGAPGATKCPACNSALEHFQAGAGTLQDCGNCGGQFVEHALLRELLERREVYGVALPRRATPHNPLLQPLRYLKCPACADLMNRRNFGKTSGIIVDVCHRHGVWFDPGELPRILAFVEAGGLMRARRLELAELERHATFRRELQNASVGPASTRIAAEPSLLADLGDAAVALLSYVREKLFHR